jgi:hypothetical protein
MGSLTAFDSRSMKLPSVQMRLGLMHRPRRLPKMLDTPKSHLVWLSWKEPIGRRVPLTHRFAIER